MRGASLHFARKIPSPSEYQGLIVTDLMSLSDLKALWGDGCPPALTYFHENQLSYPLPEGETIDYQFGFTDITTGLAAARVLFNSWFHHDSFFASLPAFIKMMPEFHPGWVVEAIRSKSDVLRPGCGFPSGPPALEPREASAPPLIIWNHRWEFDKRPGAFFEALDAILARGREFRLALVGENFQVVPKEFIAARDRYGDRIVRYGFIEDRDEYVAWLRRGSIVISTSEQENFGMSIVEAVRHGCRPLLPNRLSYPEILDREFHASCLYDTERDLVDRLDGLLSDPSKLDSDRDRLATSMERYSWSRTIDAFDAELERLAAP
jgi:glycosyltransferase involved in cell wall biosynthesis